MLYWNILSTTSETYSTLCHMGTDVINSLDSLFPHFHCTWKINYIEVYLLDSYFPYSDLCIYSIVSISNNNKSQIKSGQMLFSMAFLNSLKLLFSLILGCQRDYHHCIFRNTELYANSIKSGWTVLKVKDVTINLTVREVLGSHNFRYAFSRYSTLKTTWLQ